jgi:hypothetical protein
MALTAGQINPALYPQPDYSGVVQSARLRAQEMSNIGASIGNAITNFGEENKRINQEIARGKSALKFAKANYPELADRIDEIGNIFSDPNVSKADQAAAGSQMGDFVTAMIRRQEFDKEVSLKESELGIRRAEALASPSENVNLRLGKINEMIGGKPYIVDVTFDPATGVMRRLNGSIVSQGIQSAEMIDAGLNLPMPSADGTPMPGDGTFPDYGTAAEARVLPPRMDAEAIAAAAQLTGGQSDVSNVSPMPPGTPTTIQSPNVDGPPIGMTGALPQLPPGAVPTQADAATYRPATPEEIALYGVNGQVDTATGKFVPIRPPSGMTIESDGRGGFKMVQGAGVEGKSERAEAERQKQQGDFVNEFTKTASETLKLLPNLPDNAVGAKVGSLIGNVLPGTEVGRVVSRLNTLKANLALDKINQMRAASPTGGSAGSMTVQEWPLFMQEFGSLDAAENKDDLTARLKNASLKLFNRVNGTPEERAEALKKGVITEEQNKIVERQYGQMLSDLGISEPAKSKASGLSSESNDIYKEFLGQ